MSPRRKLSAATFLVAFLSCLRPGPDGAQAARPLTELEQEQEVSLAFETPHTAWAKPWAGGRVRALFFTRYRSRHTDGREIVELAQRFDLEADAAYYDPSDEVWLGEEEGLGYWNPRHFRERWEALASAEYDLYVFLGVEPEQLPESMLARLRQAVMNGTGAVLAESGGRGLLSGHQQPASPGDSGLPPGAYYTLGAGRVALLSGREPVEYQLGWEVEYDYLSQARGRALLWAARRMPAVGLALVLPGDETPRDALPAYARLAWENTPENTVFEIRLRRKDGWRTDLPEVRGSGRGSANLLLPRLRAGRYYLEAIARGASGVENWAARSFRVTAPEKISLDLDRDWADPEAEWNATLSGRLVLSGDSDAPPGGLRVQLRDRRGRVLARRELPAGDTRFRFPVDRWLPMLLWAEAVLTRGGQEVAASVPLPVRITRRRRGEFNFVMWGAPGGELGPHAVESLARAGVTTILERGEPPAYLAAHGIAYMPYATWLGGDFYTLPGSLNRDGVMRPRGCYHDRERMDGYIGGIVANQAMSRAHGTLAYSLGDENAVRGSCLSPHCLSAYRAYLGEKYGGDIAALNKSWGTGYTTFGDITLLEPGTLPAPDAPQWFRDWYAERLAIIEENYPSRHRPETLPMDEAAIRLGDINDEVAALQSGNFARWYDRQAFQTWTVVQLVKRFGTAFSEIDPFGLAGFEGTNSFAIPANPSRIRQGGDIDLMAREFGWWGPYRDASNEVLRSLVGPEYPRGNWFGYFRDVRRETRNYWRMLNDHLTQVQWWRWSGVGRYHGLLAPHLAPYRNRRAMLEDTEVIREGLGTLLMHSEMLDDGVALLYSMPSTYISHFDGNESYAGYSGTQSAWRSHLRAAGLQFRYVTNRQLRLGEFDPATARVFILPMGLALGESEAAALRDFVARGGTLIADIRPGTYTGHCKPRPAGILDDVFGVRRPSQSDAAAAAVEVPELLSWPGGRVDPAVETTTGVARGSADGRPVLIVNHYGAGRALLLNFPLPGAPASELVAELMREAGVSAPLLIRQFRAPSQGAVSAATPAERRVLADDDEQDEDAQLVDIPLADAPGVRRWRNGAIEFISIISGQDMDLVVTIPDTRYVYDLRRRQALGPTVSFPAALERDRAYFFALLPEPAPAPRLAADRRFPATPDGITVTAGARPGITMSVPGAAGLHALRIGTVGPDGRGVDYFDRVVVTDGAEKRIQLPFAYNDPTGEWRLLVTDLYTNRTESLKINLAAHSEAAPCLVYTLDTVRADEPWRRDEIISTGNLEMLNLETRETRLLTDSAAIELILNPAFTPPGDKVIFTARFAGDDFRAYLVPVHRRLTASGQFPVRFGGEPFDTAADYVALSPDFDDREPSPGGHHPGLMAWSRNSGAGRGLWVKSFETGRAVRILAEEGLTIRHPVFVDPGKIVYVGRKSGEENLWLIPAGGGTPVNLTRNGSTGVRYSRVLSSAGTPGLEPRIIYSKTFFQAYAWRPWNIYSRAVTDIGPNAETMLAGTGSDELSPAFYGDETSAPALGLSGLMIYEAALIGARNNWLASYDLATGQSNHAREELTAYPLPVGQPNWGGVAMPGLPAPRPEEPVSTAESRLFFIQPENGLLASADGPDWRGVRLLNPGAVPLPLKNPAVSGTGGTVAVEDGAGALLRLNHDATHVETPAPAAAAGHFTAQPALSRDGRFMLYVSAAPGADYGTLSVLSPPDGSHGAGGPLLLDPADPGTTIEYVQDPSFDQRMTRIVYRKVHPPEEEGIHLLRVDADRETGTVRVMGTPLRLTGTLAGVYNRQPAFSPDGRHIVFVSNRRGEENRIFVMDASRGETGGGRGLFCLATGSYPVFGPITSDPEHWFLAFNTPDGIQVGRVSRDDPRALVPAGGATGIRTEGRFAWGQARTAGSLAAHRTLRERVRPGAEMDYLVDISLDRGRMPDGFVVQETLPATLLDPDPVLAPGVKVDGADASDHVSIVTDEEGNRLLRIVFHSGGAGFPIDPLADNCLIRITLRTSAEPGGQYLLGGRVEYNWNMENRVTVTTGGHYLEKGNLLLPVDAYDRYGRPRQPGDPGAINSFNLLHAVNAWKTDARLRGPRGFWPEDPANWDDIILAIIQIWAGDRGARGWMGAAGIGETRVREEEASTVSGEYIYIPAAADYQDGFLYQPGPGATGVGEMHWTQGAWRD